MAVYFIVGYMASGKSAYGRRLAREKGLQFVDLDFYIEQRFRKTIAQIFAEEGEAEFRRKETAMLRETGEFEDIVISCGGGTPCFDDNMDYMLGRGEVIFLDTPAATIVERLVANNSRRPLMAGKSAAEIARETEAGLAHRMPVYRRAHRTIKG